MTALSRAAQVLADHTYSYSSMDHGDHCACGAAGPDHAAHQADTLAQAGLLADGAPPETPTGARGGVAALRLAAAKDWAWAPVGRNTVAGHLRALAELIERGDITLDLPPETGV